MEIYDECEYCDNKDCHLNYIETYTSAGVIALCDDCEPNLNAILEEWGIPNDWD